MCFGQIQDRIERVAIWSNETSMARLRASGVRVIHGLASFLDPHTLKVIDNANQAITVKAKSFIIASGSCNDDDDTIPHDERLVINCDSLLRTTNWSIPKRPIMIGANSQGIEYASTLASLVGVAVTVIDRRTEILDDVDSDMRQRLIDDMKLRLTTFKLGCTVSSVVVDREANDVVVTCDDGTILRSDLVIFTGKKVGNTAGLGLQDVLGADSIDKRGFIRVNKDMQTAQPHIYAVGNVIADTGISYRSSQQGMEAACHIVGDCVRIRAQDDELIPHTINSIPLISRVGPTDEALRRAGRPFVSGFADFHELAKGLMLQRKGYMKLSVCPITHKLLAVHTFGTSANELVHIGQVVVANNGTVNTLINNIWNYPSFAEAYRVAAFNALAKCQK